MRAESILVAALTVLAAGCGARGAPMAPLRTVPPSLPSVEISQLGTRALVRFLPIADTIDMGNDEEITIERAELLLLTERYPVLTAPILAQGLDRARTERLELARLAVELAAERAEERRLAEERLAAEAAAAAAGIELPPEEDSVPEEEPVDEEEPITEEQRLLDQLPGNVLREWREAGVESRILVEAARWFEEAVDDLWDLLGMPTAIVDTRRPPQLPRPSLIIEKAAQLARTHPYEGSLEVAVFLTRAAVVAAIPFEDINDYIVDGRARLDYNIGTSSSGPMRTRYYFAVRAVDTEGKMGRIDTILALAPGGVPLAPADLAVEVTADGARLEWSAPAGDVWGDMIDADEINYNIYRRVVDSEVVAVTPINYPPIADTAYLDAAMSWGDQYLYEVRALAAPPTNNDTPPLVEPEPPQGVMVDPANPTLLVVPAEPTGPKKESSGALTPPVLVVDTFKPDKPLNLEAVRAATRITLRWTASYAADLIGYRVYRRSLIDDPCNPLYLPDDELPIDDSDDDGGESDCLDLTIVEAMEEESAEDDTAGVDDAPDAAESNDELPREADVESDNIGQGDQAATDEPDGVGQDDQTATGEPDDVGQDDQTATGEPDDIGQGDQTATDEADGEATDDERPIGETLDDQANDDAEADDSESDEPDDERGGNEVDDGVEPAGRRRRGNALVADGWEMLTAVVIRDVRYTDPTASADRAWEFVVEAVDDTGNVSETAVVKVRLDDDVEDQ